MAKCVILVMCVILHRRRWRWLKALDRLLAPRPWSVRTKTSSDPGGRHVAEPPADPDYEPAKRSQGNALVDWPEFNDRLLKSQRWRTSPTPIAPAAACSPQ